jgi:hypothetical protein
MLRAALTLAARGFAVFPCRPRDKRPAVAHGCKAATRDVVDIQQWWHAMPDANIGIATGAVSNLFVLDIDGAEPALARLEAEHGELPQTVEAITARGRHLYFRHPGGEICNTAGKLADGIDSRGDGGYVLAPPSIHPDGRRYCWSVDSAGAIADPPRWLLDVLMRPTDAPAAPPTEWREAFGQPAYEGRRNVTVAKLAGHLAAALRRSVCRAGSHAAVEQHALCPVAAGLRCRPHHRQHRRQRAR